MTSPIPTEGGHTPGPWEVCGQFVRTPFRHGEPGAAGLMIADVRFGIWPPAQHDANARLIAAAPAMLEALTKVSMSAVIIPGMPSEAALSVEVLKEVAAALALATGGEDVR